MISTAKPAALQQMARICFQNALRTALDNLDVLDAAGFLSDEEWRGAMFDLAAAQDAIEEELPFCFTTPMGWDRDRLNIDEFAPSKVETAPKGWDVAGGPTDQGEA